MARSKLILSTLILVVLTVGAFAQERIADVIYHKKGGVAFTMDVFKPVKPNGIAMIWMVSGGWVSSHDSINVALANEITQSGITLFQVVHGAQPRYQVPEISETIQRAVRFVRFNAKTYGIDPNKLGISGGSAGGHLSLMMAAYGGPGVPTAKDPIDRESSAVNAVACFYPPTDFENWGGENRAAFSNPLLRTGYGKAFGITKESTKEELETLAKSLSPMNGFTAKTCPVLIIHGDKDALVPLQQSESAIAKLKGLGVDTKLIVRPGKGHGWADVGEDLAEFVAWFKKHLGAK